MKPKTPKLMNERRKCQFDPSTSQKRIIESATKRREYKYYLLREKKIVFSSLYLI